MATPQPMPMPAPPGAPMMPPPGVPGMPGIPGAPGARPPMAPPMMAGKGGPPGGPPGAMPPGKPGQPGQPVQPGQENPDDQLQPQLGFFQLPWVQNVLPFVTSLVVHAAIIVIAILFATVVVVQVQQLVEEQTVIPESTMAENTPPGGVPNQGVGGDPLRQAMQNTTPDAGTPEGWANKAGPPDASIAAEGGGAGNEESAGLISIGAGGLGKGGGSGAGSGSGAGGGSGDGGGPLAMFGTPGGGAIGPKGPVFGNGGNAKKIVFICDATGTMLNKMATLKNELSKAIDKLKPVQSFNIVFYYDGPKVFALDQTQLVPATPDNKRRAFKFLDDVTPSGPTDPIPAITLAFKLQPQLVYFLSDGEFNNLKTYDEVMGECKKLNPASKIKMNTILFETFDQQAEEVMQKMAKDAGGTYRYVKEADLNQ